VKQWNPDDEIARAREARVKPSWPQGATAGLAVLAGCCIGVAAILYHLAGPRDVFTP
jgi:hypothetical protein